ncbi:MAG: hypothetical protein LVQ96_02220 [Thermoplasmatales archaeon]|nr:hypothetical protein [Thermoplasmatales archaeon]
MKESKKKNWWKSLTPQEQENQKNVKKLFHRPFFQRRREDKQMRNAQAYAEKQLADFHTHLDNLENYANEIRMWFPRLKTRLIGYLITQEAEELKTEEIFADEGGGGEEK